MELFIFFLKEQVLMNNIFYIAAWSKDDPQGGIHIYDSGNNGLKKLGFAPLPMAGYICFSPDGKTLYATGRDGNDEALAAFAVREDVFLEALGMCPSGGVSTCHNCTSPDGGFLYAANYSSGDFAEFALDCSGKILERTRLVRHTGSGPVAGRQESAHPHFVSMTPDGKYLAVADLGIDKLVCYPYEKGKGIDVLSSVESSMPSGCGPRHIHFAGNGIAYLLTELGNTVLSLNYADGRFSVINEISLLPGQCHCDTKASAIRMSADGRFLAATNRGFDSVVFIAVDGKGGMKINQTLLSGGSSPRDVYFLPGGTQFAAANEFSGNIWFFDYDREKGTVVPNGLKLEYPRPICIAWYDK